MDDLKLPIDPRTLEASVSSRRLRSIELDGTLSHEEPKSTNTTRTEELSRIWEEYPDGVLDLTEAKLEGLDLEADAVEIKEDEEEIEEPHDRSQLMAYQDMQKLRDMLFDQLNTARNELWYALELAKTLGVSSNFTIDAPPVPGQPHHKRPRPNPTDPTAETKAEPPILPAGSYTATPASLPIKTQQNRILDAELSLAAKHQALDDCTALIDSAVEELEVMADAGGRFWRDLRQLKDGRSGKGRWAVVPRPDFARTMAEGEKARDVVIPYAVDEAPVQLRTRCLAAFDLDPSKAESLSFGARTHRCLRVSIRTDGTTTQSALPTQQETGIEMSMEHAQLEALDEELYSEILGDVSRHPSGEVTPKLAIMKMGERDVIFELCDVRETQSSSEPFPMCDLIVLASRLSLLQIHRRRKARLINRSATGMTVLQPILQILQFHSMSEAVRPVLDQISDTLRKAGLASRVEALHSASHGGGLLAVERLLAGEDSLGEISVTYKLEVEHCQGISVDILNPGVCRITTSRATFSVQDMEDLPSIIGDDLNGQLLTYTESVLKSELDESHRSRIFKDELESMIRIDLDTVLEVSITAPYESIKASATGSINSVYDGLDLLNWIKNISTSMETS